MPDIRSFWPWKQLFVREFEHRIAFQLWKETEISNHLVGSEDYGIFIFLEIQLV